MPKVSIIVLQYNQSSYTLACLESLTKLTYPDFNVIVVDNASDVQHLKNVDFWISSRKLLNFKLLNSTTNTGYSAGNNIGIQYALEKSAEYILILNNDTIVPSDFLEKLTKLDADIVGIEQGSIVGFDYLSGVALLCKREVYEKIGFFDERYFLYYEDVEFSVRARKAGLTLAFAHIQIEHAVSASTKTLGTANLLYYHTRNAMLLLHDHGTLLQKISLPFQTFWIMIKQRIKIALGRNIEISQAILQGARDYHFDHYGKKD